MSRAGLAAAVLLSPFVMLQACVFELAEMAPGSGGAGGAATGSGAATPTDWWDDGFAHRMRLELTGESEAVQDAVLAVVVDESFPYDTVEPGGADLRFVDADGALLPYEIERWDPSGDSLLWVRVPEVDAGTGDLLWLYWGNPGQPPGDTPAATWAGYESVVHMSDAPTGDGTAIDNPGDGEDHEAMGLAAANVVEGVFGPAYRFDGGVGQAITASTTAAYAVPFDGQASIEGWFRWDGTTSGTLAVHEGCCLGFLVQLDSGFEVATRWGATDCCTGGPGYANGSVALAAGTETEWHHYVSVVDRAAGTIQLYVDGSALGDPLAIDPGTDVAPQGHYRIGADFGGNANFGGDLDEARFATFAYEPSRIALHARAGRDEVIAYGAPESRP